MVFSHILMNPPYDVSLHLKILESVLEQNPQSEIVCLHPAGWYEDPIYQYKHKSDKRRFQKTIVDKLSNVNVIETRTLAQFFPGSKINTDLMISLFNENTGDCSILKKEYPFIPNLLDKIESFTNLKGNNLWDNMDFHNGKVDGWRCVVYEMVPQSWDSVKNWACTVVSFTFPNVYYDGKNENGEWWAVARKSPRGARKEGEPFQCSIKFNTKEEALNFEQSMKTNFIRNLEHLIKFNAKTQVSYVPFMGDYTKVWSDDDYCDFFKLSEQERAFMKRCLNDYRIKDFIEYLVI